MTAPRSGAALYNPQILALAVELADYPLTADLDLRGEAVSRVCGSRVTIGHSPRGATLGRTGARVTACAIGQAAAALFLRSATGRDAAQLAAALDSIENWLADHGETPDWPGIAILEPARAYPARHAAILLPWKAALAALSNPIRAD